MFRPEVLREVGEGDKADIEGRITDVLYHGNIRRYIVDVGCPSPIIYETSLPHTVGESLRLVIPHYRVYT
jgi:hypothetical protein